MEKEVETFYAVDLLRPYDNVSVAFDSVKILGSSVAFRDYVGRILGSPELSGLGKKVAVAVVGPEALFSLKAPGYLVRQEDIDFVQEQVEEQFGKFKSSYRLDDSCVVNFSLQLASE